MNIRPKTLRRLLILFAILFVVAGLIGIFYRRSVRRNFAQLQKMHDEAMNAYQAGDYVNAVDLLAAYRAKAPATGVDPAAEFAYGVSRIHVELPDGRHIKEGIRTFEQYLQNTKPDDSAAQHELLRLYVRAGYRPEAVHLADDMLARGPGDTEVLELKTIALIGQHNPQAALAVSQTLNQVDPLNLKGHLFTVYLMGETGVPPETVIAHAGELQKSHRDDPRFDVLLAFAYEQGKQSAESIKWLKSAAGHDAPDAPFVGELVARLDRAELYADADAFLARAADTIPDVLVQRLYAQRLWQDLKPAQLAERLKSQDPSAPSCDSVLLGYRILALYSLDKSDEARPLAHQLSHRNDAASAAWTICFQAQDAMPPLTAPALARQLQKAVTRDPENPVLRVMLAETFERMNEMELAIQQSLQTIARTPAWVTPYVLIAQAQTATGRYAEAVDSARRAVKCAETRQALAAWAKAYFAMTSELKTTAGYNELLLVLTHLQQTWHDADTLPIYVTILARTGRRDDAIAAVKTAPAAAPPLPAATLIQLAEVADSEKLNLGADVRYYLARSRGSALETVVAQAQSLLQSGKPGDGLSLLLQGARGHDKDLGWQVAIASYRDRAGTGNAIRDWLALGEKNPADLQVQQAILQSPSRLADRDFWGRTIDRSQGPDG